MLWGVQQCLTCVTGDDDDDDMFGMMGGGGFGGLADSIMGGEGMPSVTDEL